MQYNKNMAKIRYNPYIPKIEYFHWNLEEEEWESPSFESPFLRPELINTTIQNKAYDIIKHMDDIYNPGNVGLDLYFEGTIEDMDYFTEILSRYYSSRNITVISGEFDLLPAVHVKGKIEDIFSNMKDMFSEYPDDEVVEYVSKFSEAVRPTIPICVMGTYSAGKSAFINSLLGIELLPSASDPTTAKTYKISSGAKYEIKFSCHNKENVQNTIRVQLDNEKIKITKSGELEIVKELNKIKNYATVEERMYHALSIINDYDTKNNTNPQIRISDLVEVTLPLKSLVLPFDKYDFIVYDTPGSNAAGNTNHIKVLKKAMEGQTNGLPIFVATPDTMDTDDCKKLIETIDELGGALDKGNLMIIVNKSDEKSSNTLRDKKGNFDKLTLSKLNPAGVYFVSAVMGLGFKKMMFGDTIEVEAEDEEGNTIHKMSPKWIDEDYSSVFEDCRLKFRRKKEPSKLYSFNIIPQHQFDDYNDTTVIDEYYAYRNSGLHAIETVIKDFAEKYSIYNKCKNASEYLTNAMSYLNNKINSHLEEQESLLNEITSLMTTQQKDVLKKLDDECTSKTKCYIKEYVKMIQGINAETIKAFTFSVTGRIAKFWDESKGDKERKTSVTSKVNNLLEEEVKKYWENGKDSSLTFWKDKESELKRVLISIIVDSPDLTEEQQELLKNEIMDIDCIPKYEYNASLKGNDLVGGLLFKRIKHNAPDKCLIHLKKELLKVNNSLTTQSSTALKEMTKEVSQKFIDLISQYNPQMIDLNKQMRNCEADIEHKANQSSQIQEYISDVNNMLQFKLADR